MVRRYSFLCGSLALLLLTGTARALDNPEVFGTDEEGITVVGWQDFFPFQSDLPYGGSIERYGSSTMYAGLNMLPNGSLITQLTFYVRDDDAGSNFQGALCHSAVDSSNGQGNGSGCEPSVSTAGQPGEDVVFANYDPPLPVLYRQVNGNSANVVNYFLQAQLPTSDVAIRMVRIRWKRQVSPAPQAATFNDVPTNHPFFRYIEALAASGITAGCGTDIYCPDAPLTRGQMAVFLAKALGLNWPWDAVAP